MDPDNGHRTGEYIPARGTPRAGGVFGMRIVQVPVAGAVGFGTMLAIAISYVHNQSIGWAIVHGLLSWLFVIYAALFY